MNKSSWARCKNSLKPNGRYLLSSFKMKQLGQMLWTSVFSAQSDGKNDGAKERQHAVAVRQ